MNLKMAKKFMENLNNNLKEITNCQEWQSYLDKVERHHCFFSDAWEKQVEKYFSGWQFKHFIFLNNFLISVLVNKEGRAVTVQFSEVGNIIALDYRQELEISDLKIVLASIFNSFKLTINAFYCSVKNTEETKLLDYVLPLNKFNSFQELELNYRKSTRQEIDNAQVLIKPCENVQELKQVYKLYLQNIRAKMNLVLPYGFFEYWFKNDETFLLSLLNNKIVGFSLYLENKNIIHYFLNASSFVGKQNGATHALLSSQIKNSFNQQKKYFEFGGTKKDSSLETFKKGWGGEAYNIYSISNGETNNSQPKGRYLWKFVPLWLLPSLSKILWKRFL